MELRVLNYFLMAAREENITRAAQLLHVTQPTLSRQLMQLEEELGVTLFKRSNHAIILTDDGMLLKRRAEEILALAEKTKRDFLQGEELSGEICVGSGELQSTQTLCELFASFQEKYPLVQYDIFSGDSDNIKERIERGSLDLGLLLEPVDISKYAFIRMPPKEEWGILAREDSPLALKGTASPEDLSGVPLILSKRGPVQNEFMSWLGPYAEKAEIVASGNLLYNLAIMVRNRIGVAVTIHLDARYEGLRFIPLAPRLESSTVLAWKKASTFSPATSAFICHVKKCLLGISCDSL